MHFGAETVVGRKRIIKKRLPKESLINQIIF